MAILQVKSMPDELYAALQHRARGEGISMSEYVVRTLRKDLSRPTTAEWLERVRARVHEQPLRNVDVVAVLDEVRAEYGVTERTDE